MACVQYGHIQKKDKESQWVPRVCLQCSEMRLKFKVFRFIGFYYMCMDVLPPRMFVYHEHAVSWGQKRVSERSSLNRAKDMYILEVLVKV